MMRRIFLRVLAMLSCSRQAPVVDVAGRGRDSHGRVAQGYVSQWRISRGNQTQQHRTQAHPSLGHASRRRVRSHRGAVMLEYALTFLFFGVLIVVGIPHLLRPAFGIRMENAAMSSLEVVNTIIQNRGDGVLSGNDIVKAGTAFRVVLGLPASELYGWSITVIGRDPAAAPAIVASGGFGGISVASGASLGAADFTVAGRTYAMPETGVATVMAFAVQGSFGAVRSDVIVSVVKP